MKKRVLCMVLVLALALTIIMPAIATAKGLDDFHAEGIVIGIDQGDIKAAGNSGRWIVKDRTLFGAFTDGPASILGSFTMTYHANIESTDSQAGSLQGVLVVGDYKLNVTAKTTPIVPTTYPPTIYPKSIDIPGVGTVNTLVTDCLLELNGSWTMTSGSVGNGTVDADIFVQICVVCTDYPALEGHVVGFLDTSSFILDGHWKP